MKQFMPPLLIGVVNAENELSAMFFGKEVAEQGGTDSADVQIAGGTRSKTGADCHKIIIAQGADGCKPPGEF